MTPIYKRILLKLSGEALAGPKGFGIDPLVIGQIADEIAQVQLAGVQIGIVIGGGIFLGGQPLREFPGLPVILWVCWQQ